VWSGKLLLGSVLPGFGPFNVVDEGLVDHQWLGLHRERDRAARAVDLLEPRFSRMGSGDDRRRRLAAGRRPRIVVMTR